MRTKPKLQDTGNQKKRKALRTAYGGNRNEPLYTDKQSPEEHPSNRLTEHRTRPLKTPINIHNDKFEGDEYKSHETPTHFLRHGSRGRVPV